MKKANFLLQSEAWANNMTTVVHQERAVMTKRVESGFKRTLITIAKNFGFSEFSDHYRFTFSEVILETANDKVHTLEIVTKSLQTAHIVFCISNQDQQLHNTNLNQLLINAFPHAEFFVSVSCKSSNPTICFRRRFDSNNLDTTKNTTLDDTVFKPLLFCGGNKEQKSPASIARKEIANLFFEMHSDARDIDGLHADAALDEICKILFTIIYLEKTHDSKTISPINEIDFRKLYCEATFSTTSTSSTSRAFSENLLLSTPCLRKILTRLSEINISSLGIDLAGRAFQQMLLPAIRSGMGQYFTPEEIVELMVQAAGPQKNERLIDPFCGSAHFLRKSIERLLHENQICLSEVSQYTFKNIYGIEKSERMVRIATTDLALAGDGFTNIVLGDSLQDFSNYDSIKEEGFDVILTNPPFGSILSSEAISQLGHFQLAAGRSKVPLEIIGLERIVQLLREGGRAAVVIPDSILANPSLDYVRDWLSMRVEIGAIISLPHFTFSPYGANIKTSIIFFRKCKYRNPNKKTQTCLVCIDKIGYDAAGRIVKENDIPKAATLISDHLKQEGWL